MPLFADESFNATFEFEDYLKHELHLDGDRKPAPDLCRFYLRGSCQKGKSCTFRHGRPGERRTLVVCKHWLRGLCKKGDNCEFLHEYNLKRMPECWFYSKYGECVNAEDCLYLHIDPESKQIQCPWYNRGFCKHGPSCRLKHVRKQMCLMYLSGWCPLGPNCGNGHAKFELPDMDKLEMPVAKQHVSEKPPGYLSSTAAASGGGAQRPKIPGQGPGEFRPLSEVVCFKCGQKGHYANRCPN